MTAAVFAQRYAGFTTPYLSAKLFLGSTPPPRHHIYFKVTLMPTFKRPVQVKAGITIRQRIWLHLFEDYLSKTPPASAPDTDAFLGCDKSSVYLNKMAKAGEVIRVPRTENKSSRVTFYVDDSCFIPDDLPVKEFKRVISGEL